MPGIGPPLSDRKTAGASVLPADKFSVFIEEQPGRVTALITLVITSQKGGVGKTTVAINLAHSFACRGWQTLLIDSDPQNSVGLSLSEKTRHCPGYYDFLHFNCDVDELMNLKISPQEGFMLTRVDGSYDIKSILKMSSGIHRVDAQVLFWKLRKSGHVAF